MELKNTCKDKSGAETSVLRFQLHGNVICDVTLDSELPATVAQMGLLMARFAQSLGAGTQGKWEVNMIHITFSFQPVATITGRTVREMDLLLENKQLVVIDAAPTLATLPSFLN